MSARQFLRPFGISVLAVFIIGVATDVTAQHGTAPNNYYPDDYNGSTFTGKVVDATDDTITLAYSHGSKTETFVAHAKSLCSLPSSKSTTSPMPLTKVQQGATVMAFYEEKTIKANGHKDKENQLIGLSFLEVNGRSVSEEHRAIFYCVPGPVHATFRAFGNN